MTSRHTSCGKTRFRDKVEAQRALHLIQARSTRDRIPGRAYYCPMCHGYHLTAKPER